MNLSTIIKNILTTQKVIDIKKLPSQGLFYKEDFEISIKKADIEDIIEYEYKYEKDDLSLIINRVKRIVEKNTIISDGYSYSDIKSIDIVFIFLEIVKFTNNKSIDVMYFNDKIGRNDTIMFDSKNFNYAKIGEDIMDKYDSTSREFIIDGFRYSVPCIGVENSLTNFLISISDSPNAHLYNNYSYDFLYFIGHKSHLRFDEIDNLIQIFNYDMSDEDKSKASSIIKGFYGMGKYTLRKDYRVIEVTSKIDLEKIWK